VKKNPIGWLSHRFSDGVASAALSGSDEAGQRLCVLSSSDPYQNSRLHEAAGTKLGQFAQVSLPLGISLRSDGSLERSVELAISATCLRYRCSELLIVAPPFELGQVDMTWLIDQIRARGLSREDLDSDIRSFLGLTSDPHSFLSSITGALSRSLLLPKDLKISTALLDPRAPSLTLVDQGITLSGRPRDERALGATGPIELAGPSIPTKNGGPLFSALPLPALQSVLGPVPLVQLEPLLSQSREAPLSDSPGPNSPLGLTSTQAEFFTPLSTAGSAQSSAPSPRRPALGKQTRTQRRPSPPAPLKAAQSLAASRPPLSASPPRPASAATPQAQDESPVQVSGIRITSSDQRQLKVVRNFYRQNIPYADRLKIFEASSAAFSAGLGAEISLRVVFQPVLKMGAVRYQVLNELLALKEISEREDPKAVVQLLKSLLVGS